MYMNNNSDNGVTNTFAIFYFNVNAQTSVYHCCVVASAFLKEMKPPKNSQEHFAFCLANTACRTLCYYMYVFVASHS